jgi:Putative member of DMT superfamily (DUF486)
VPANRIGYTKLSLAQLKVLQEVITLVVFVPVVMRPFNNVRFRTDFIWAGLCLVGAVFFAFRGGWKPRQLSLMSEFAVIAKENDSPARRHRLFDDFLAALSFFARAARAFARF